MTIFHRSFGGGFLEFFDAFILITLEDEGLEVVRLTSEEEDEWSEFDWPSESELLSDDESSSILSFGTA